MATARNRLDATTITLKVIPRLPMAGPSYAPNPCRGCVFDTSAHVCGVQKLRGVLQCDVDNVIYVAVEASRD